MRKSLSILVLAFLVLPVSLAPALNRKLASAGPVGVSAELDLPPLLQKLVDANPLRESQSSWYPIPEVSSAVSIADTDQDGFVYIDHNGASFYWSTEAQQTKNQVLYGWRQFTGLASGGIGKVVYGWGKGSGVWRLVVGQESWQDLKGPNNPDTLRATPDGKYLYALEGEDLWRWSEDGQEWDKLPIPPPNNFRTADFGFVLLNSGVLVGVEEIETIIDSRGTSGTAHQLYQWEIGDPDGWQPLDWPAGVYHVERLGASGDGEEAWALTSEGELWGRGRTWPLTPVLRDSFISVLFDPQVKDVLYLGTLSGSILIQDFEIKMGFGSGEVYALTYHRKWHVPLVSQAAWISFVILPEQVGVVAAPAVTTSAPTLAVTTTPVQEIHSEVPALIATVAPKTIPTAKPNPLFEAIRGQTDNFWFRLIGGLTGFLTLYLLGMMALLLLAQRGGSQVFSRSWLTSIAARPLLITPGLGRWALFLGYGHRLREARRAVDRAAKDYFGLPALDPDGEGVLPDPQGDSLHAAITGRLGPQQPVLVMGKGGSGKSTLLARLAYLGVEGKLPAGLKDYLPVLVTATDYHDSLVKAAASALHDRCGVAVDEATLHAQFQTGKFLVLFDGVSEVAGSVRDATREILQTAQNADYGLCRFIITSRALEDIPEGVAIFHLQPLNAQTIESLLPRYNLSYSQQSYIRRQLRSFGEKPIEPLLFAMALAQSGDEEVSYTRVGLYQRYFRRLLHVEKNNLLWSGWQSALEMLAQWFYLDTGRRGVGLPHERVVDLLLGKGENNPGVENLVKRLARLYRLDLHDELELLEKLEAAGVLQGGRRWRFAHDTFEEYFAASRVVSFFYAEERLPDLSAWLEDPERWAQLREISEFVDELAEGEMLERIHAQGLPWPSTYQG